MNRIDKLTPEQEAMLPAIRDEWERIGLCTDPADRPRAESAIKAMYAQAGLAEPRSQARIYQDADREQKALLTPPGWHDGTNPPSKEEG